MAIAELSAERRMEVNVAANNRDVSALIALLKDEDWRVRQLATFALGKIGETAVESLVEVLNDSTLTPDVRGHAAIALRDAHDPRAFYPLLARLADDSCQVRGYVAYALGGYRDSRAVEPLITCLQEDANEHCSVRNWVAQSLGEIGDSRAVDTLRDVEANDPDRGVRATAKRSLAAILGESS
jgi:HEAT repeat protein